MVQPALPDVRLACPAPLVPAGEGLHCAVHAPTRQFDIQKPQSQCPIRQYRDGLQHCPGNIDWATSGTHLLRDHSRLRTGNTSAKGHIPFIIFALLDVLRAFPGEVRRMFPEARPFPQLPARGLCRRLRAFLGRHALLLIVFPADTCRGAKTTQGGICCHSPVIVRRRSRMWTRWCTRQTSHASRSRRLPWTTSAPLSWSGCAVRWP